MVVIQVKVFWVVTLCTVAVGYQCFRGSARSSEKFASYHNNIQHQIPENVNLIFIILESTQEDKFSNWIITSISRIYSPPNFIANLTSVFQCCSQILKFCNILTWFIILYIVTLLLYIYLVLLLSTSIPVSLLAWWRISALCSCYQYSLLTN